MHAPIELGPRLYGVLTVGARGARPLRRGRPRAAREAGPLVRRGDRQRDRLPARAAHRARADARLRAGVAAEAARLRDRAALRARRRTRPPAATCTAPGRVGGGDSVAVLVGDVAGKGVETAALSAMVRFFIEARSWDSLCPAHGARAGELDAARQASARRVRDRVPGDPHERLAALHERRPPAAAASCAATAMRAAREPRPAARGDGGPDLRVERARAGRPATSCSRTRTA